MDVSGALCAIQTPGTHIRCTFVTCTDKMKCLVVCRTNFFMDTKTRFLGARSRRVSYLVGISRHVERITYDDNTVAQVPHLCSKKKTLVSTNLDLYQVHGVEPLLSYPVHDYDPRYPRRQQTNTICELSQPERKYSPPTCRISPQPS